MGRYQLNKRSYSSLAVLAVAACAIGLAPVHRAYAADTPAQPVIGVVDVQKVFTEYKLTKTSNTEIETMVQNFKTELDVRKDNKLLTDAQLKELIALKEKPNPTDADKQQIAQLEGTSKQLDEEMTSLIQKPDATDQDRARLKQLRDLSNQNEAAGNSLADDYNQQVDKRKSDLSDKITADIKAAIAKVAQQKGMATVVDKIAVLYGGVDITEDVVKVLNAG